MKSVSDIQFDGDDKLIEIIGKDMDKAFIEEVKSWSFRPGHRA